MCVLSQILNNLTNFEIDISSDWDKLILIYLDQIKILRAMMIQFKNHFIEYLCFS